MVNLANILIAIIIFFVIYLSLRSFIKVKICVLCAAVSTTWLGLLVLWLVGTNVDPLLIGTLMGGSAVGVMYLLEQKLSEKWAILKLPFLLTLFSIIYMILSDAEGQTLTHVILLVLWGIFLGVFFLQKSKDTLKGIGKRLVECCKNW